MKARINPGFSFFIFELCYNVREEWYIWIKDGIIYWNIYERFYVPF